MMFTCSSSATSSVSLSHMRMVHCSLVTWTNEDGALLAGHVDRHEDGALLAGHVDIREGGALLAGHVNRREYGPLLADHVDRHESGAYVLFRRLQ